jgi:two-component system LytT family response regulator
MKSQQSADNRKEKFRVLKLQTANAGRANEILPVSNSDGISLIRFSRIVYLKSESNYTYIFLSDGSKICGSKTMKYFINKLPKDDFIRVHRSYYVSKSNISHISFSTHPRIELLDSSWIPVSRTGKKELSAWIDRM